MRYAVALLTLSLILTPACIAQDNPITNGGFEQLNEDGTPADWSVLGEFEITEDAHSGEQAIAVIRESEEGIVGLNREWEAESGRQGTMLSQLKGGVKFWYKAASATPPDSLHFYVIPMSAAPFEETSAGREVFNMPPGHVGDGQWHEGVLAYDYTGEDAVKWVHISPRVRGSEGRLLLDDIEWVEQVGPVPAFMKAEMKEVAGREGQECQVRAVLTNKGDAEVGAGTLRIEVPDGLRALGPNLQTVSALQPGRFAELTWNVVGARSHADRIKLFFEAAGRTASTAVAYEADLEVIGLLPRRFILGSGETTTVALRLRNNGHAMVRNISAALMAGAPLSADFRGRRQTMARLAPQTEADVIWQITAGRQTPRARLKAVVNAENADRDTATSTIIVGPAIEAEEGPAPAEPRAVAEVGESRAEIYNNKLRLLYPKAEFGYGIGILQRSVDGRWQTIAKMPRLSRLLVRKDLGEQVEYMVYAQDVRQVDSPRAVGPEMLPARLELIAQLTDANDVNWTITQTAFLERDADEIGLRVEAMPDRDAQVLAIDGPIVCAGEGAPEGHRRLDAIFPGLEWLVEGERSSSTLDIAEDHPHHIRYIPHPHMVTIPLMCARIQPPETAGTVVSYQWDHLADYYAGLNRPSAMFASPDRFAGRASTTMGVFAPSMPEHIETNDRGAHTPLKVAANERVSLNARVGAMAAEEGDTALIAVKRWGEQHGAPQPNPLPHGDSYRDEMRFSMAAYLDSLWLPEEEGWLGSIGGPSGNEPVVSPSYLYDMKMCLEACKAGPTREQVRERYEQVTDATGVIPAADDMGFHYVGPAERLRSETAAVDGLINQQRNDGSWRFRARIETSGVFEGMDYSELGPDNAAEVGTCARNAFVVLRYARMTGDDRSRRAGLRALEFMDRFRVPRAAQVWEVPVHTPDILASAYACQAYLEGYKVTGDQDYLDEAVYWAWTGLPFLYMWDVEGFEFLKYASIPVFGATWYRGSWFGRPVQWNGIDYAYALLRLARFDDSFDWRKVARGVTVSCMYQQSTDEEDRALWPDSISAIDKTKSGWIFAPRKILRNVYRLMGMQPTPITTTVAAGEGNIHINAAGAIAQAELAGKELSCTVAYQTPPRGYLLICNVSRPETVTVNGEDVGEVAMAGDGDAPWWRYLDYAKAVEVRLAESGAQDVRLSGVGYEQGSFRAPVAERIAFEFDAGPEYWHPTHHLGPFAVRDGVLHVMTKGGDPYMNRPNCRVPADTVSKVRIRIALEEGMSPTGQFFWTTAVSPNMDEAKSLHFEVTPVGDFREVVIPVGDHELWSGTITEVRVDPTGGAKLGEVRIDYIRGE